MPRYAYQPFPYTKSPELGRAKPGRYPVAIVGAGPVGLSAAIDLALHGIKSVVLDDNDVVSVGSRAICWAKRTLEIFDRLGVGERMVEKGVTWKVGRLFHGDWEVYSFDLLPEGGHKMPAFINLQQYHVEHYLVERCADFPDLIDLRWKNKVTQVGQQADFATATVETPDGVYSLEADYLLACDGAGSSVRGMLGLDFEGQVFEERFLITDVEMEADFPSERLFWFEPLFHPGQSALLHKQPDNIYRIDLQLGWDADPDEENKPENVIPRIKAMVGERDFEIDWVSVYTFQCRRLERFVHGRVIFAGDSAHIVSPFGARGGNSGIQDIDNLIWKLAAVLKGEGGEGLIESYNEERVHGADENILNSARSTSFMTPKSDMEKIFRDGVLDLAGDLYFARRLVNSGRLSLPCSLEGLALQTPVEDGEGIVPGEACPDAPVAHGNGGEDWLLNHLGGGFTLMSVGETQVIDGLDPAIEQIAVVRSPAPVRPNLKHLHDRTGHLTDRYGAGHVYLIRPDQHVAARFGAPDAETVTTAWKRAMSRT
ncbi:MAG TPA: FAD-dependent oxidoreductase [Afifellaceae bacterium]|nr:FAD-dependent oxidoreductase [Afifellaceae bacterium]